MEFKTPTAADTETETETETETVYDGRHDGQEEYWAYVDTERFVQKLCLSFDVANDGGYARYTEAEGESPLADHGLFYYRQKKETADELADLRSDGEMNDDQNLPNYKDQFGTPEWDHVVVSAENAEEYGIDPELFGDDEEIHVPEEYQPETDEDGTLVIWYATDGDSDYTKDDVLKALNGVKGIGDKKAGKALNALEDAGILSL
jgi:hypothetical protein